MFISENFHFLVVKFSVYLNRHTFVTYHAQNAQIQTHPTHAQSLILAFALCLFIGFTANQPNRVMSSAVKILSRLCECTD